MLRRTIDATIHQDLQERIDDVRMQLQASAPGMAHVGTQAAFDAIYRHRDDGKWLQILGQDENWFYRSGRMAQQNRPLASPAALPATGVEADFHQGGRTIRAFSCRVLVDGRSYSVETGVSMTKPQLLLHQFGLGLLLITPAVLLVAGGAGHFMSRKALSPVAEIAQEARRITDRNLDTRLPVSPCNDEMSHLSATLNHMLVRIESSFRSVRDFTANASHELRTPLARIRMETEVALLFSRPKSDYRRSLEQIHGDAIEMAVLIDNLLTLARAEAGSEVLRMSAVDLRSLVVDAANEWSDIAGRLSINLRVSPGFQEATSHQTMVLADRTALVRLLRIWLDNACKFTPPGGTIILHTELDEQTAVMAVQDSGIGIAPEEHALVFKRFYRGNIEHPGQNVGSGLGLSLATWIAEQHKTRIILESALGEGARFGITLRRVEDELALSLSEQRLCFLDRKEKR